MSNPDEDTDSPPRVNMIRVFQTNSNGRNSQIERVKSNSSIVSTNPSCVDLSMHGKHSPLSAKNTTFVTNKDHLLEAVVMALEKTIEQSDDHDYERSTVFHCRSAPTISVLDYLRRIEKYTTCSTESIIVALIYLDHATAAKHNPEPITLDEMNVHR
eukprot:TRINITY_DN804_c0_g1_i2.p1 TRINITY_DN804_c0_g1~~TRINITY_DN804_c0_g1_i2.p1  ORF type:complete len:157 (+),score=3.11 TRINITY_DN804_c0_g1_i2:141-611(+)